MRSPSAASSLAGDRRWDAVVLEHPVVSVATLPGKPRKAGPRAPGDAQKVLPRQVTLT